MPSDRIQTDAGPRQDAQATPGQAISDGAAPGATGAEITAPSGLQTSLSQRVTRRHKRRFTRVEPGGERLITIDEAAERLGISRRQFYRLRPRLIASGLQERVVGDRCRIREASLNRLIAADGEATAALC